MTEQDRENKVADAISEELERQAQVGHFYRVKRGEAMGWDEATAEMVELPDQMMYDGDIDLRTLAKAVLEALK